MNINNITNTNMNFKAHIIEDYMYYQLRDRLQEPDIGNTSKEFFEADRLLQEQPDARISIEALDEDNIYTYIYGYAETPKGKIKDFAQKYITDHDLLTNFTIDMATLVQDAYKEDTIREKIKHQIDKSV